MSEFGRIHAFAVTNRNGNVLYERFYDHLSEIQKAEMRTAMGQCSRDVSRMSNGQVGVGNFRCTSFGTSVGNEHLGVCLIMACLALFTMCDFG